MSDAISLWFAEDLQLMFFFQFISLASPARLVMFKPAPDDCRHADKFLSFMAKHNEY
jgi:hypothetical protein